MSNHSFSAAVSALLAVLTIAAGQAFKTQLAASRQGTLTAGLLGALVFLFTITSISNFKMMGGGSGARSGLTEVLIAGFIGIVSAASIHRIAITICFLASSAILYLLTVISSQRYNIAAKPVVAGKTKK
uniref:Dolichyl-diphosphooligosaccharide--protein glycosyltransferase subunit KCP2 n=1 Tax=Panagrellus redivivus TaxID=6233 RepID=A0A7E4VW86_PANRE